VDTPAFAPIFLEGDLTRPVAAIVIGGVIGGFVCGPRAVSIRLINGTRRAHQGRMEERRQSVHVGVGS
jgi:hypothetical protein